MINPETLFIKMALDAWYTQIGRTTKLIDSLTDEQLQEEVAPGRNTGTYLLGHLTAVHDALFPLLGLGPRLYPALEDVFVKNPDKARPDKPQVKVLRDYWNEVNKRLSEQFDRLPADLWLQKHATISEEDFEKEPHRNKLNVLINRTNHLANHLGQMTFLKK